MADRRPTKHTTEPVHFYSNYIFGNPSTKAQHNNKRNANGHMQDSSLEHESDKSVSLECDFKQNKYRHVLREVSVISSWVHQSTHLYSRQPQLFVTCDIVYVLMFWCTNFVLVCFV